MHISLHHPIGWTGNESGSDRWVRFTHRRSGIGSGALGMPGSMGALGGMGLGGITALGNSSFRATGGLGGLGGLTIPGGGSAMLPAVSGMAGIGGTTGLMGPPPLNPIATSPSTGPIARAFGPEVKLDGLASLVGIDINFGNKERARSTLTQILKRYIEKAAEDSSHPETRALRNGLNTLALRLTNPPPGSLSVPWGLDLGSLLFKILEDPVVLDSLRSEHALESNMVKRIGQWGFGSYRGEGLFSTACGRGEWRGHFLNELSEQFPTFVPGEYIYRGEFAGDLPKGQGRLDYPNGTFATGYFEGKDFEGWGEIHYDHKGGTPPNRVQVDGIWGNLLKGDFYSGQWWNGMPKGKGVLTLRDGRKIAGDWSTWKTEDASD